MIKQPMLAAKIESVEGEPYAVTAERELERRLQFPVLTSPKVDGLRCIILPDKGAVSRSFKPLPNAYFQKWVHDNMEALQYLDGEIIIGSMKSPTLFNTTQSGIMSAGGEPDFQLYVFDDITDPSLGFADRFISARKRVDALHSQLRMSLTLQMLDHRMCHNLQEVFHQEDLAVEEGYEGLMIRGPDNVYKSGRSTLKEGGLIKLKRFEDAEGTIVGYEPLMRNNNAPTTDNFGHQKRSSHKAGKVADDLLGKFILKIDGFDEPTVAVGSGFTEDQRRKYWEIRDELVANKEMVTFKYFPHGSKDAPRHPIFKGLRDRRDIS
jgi:DNA ligase-1